MSIPHQTRVLLVMTAQVVLSVTFIGGYFFTLNRFLDGSVLIPIDYKEVVITLLGALTTGVGLILAYWFQRQREQTPPTGG